MANNSVVKRVREGEWGREKEITTNCVSDNLIIWINLRSNFIS